MIYNSDDHVKLGGVILPGLVKSIEVKESAKIDEQEVEGSAVKPKQAVGYEDAKITIELTLDDTPTQSKYEMLEVIRALFRAVGQSVPQPIPIICEDTVKHGIDKVLFKSFSHKAESKRETISASLELWEYIPQTIKVKKASSASKSGKASSAKGAASNLSEDYQSYLKSGRGKSPAADDASASGALDRISDLPY